MHNVYFLIMDEQEKFVERSSIANFKLNDDRNDSF